MPRLQSVEEKFFRYAEKKNRACWAWKGAIGGEGYGAIQHGKQTLRAHRVSWELANGKIPSGLHVLHSCDVRACVNPKHLFLGTHRANMADMARKGRGYLNRRDRPKRFGEEVGTSILTEACVVGMRALAGLLPYSRLATHFRVSLGCVKHVMSGRRWPHLGLRPCNRREDA